MKDIVDFGPLPTTADGLKDPTLAYNPFGPFSYSTGVRYIDHMMSADLWHASRGPVRLEGDDVARRVPFDDGNMPTAIPNGYDELVNTLLWKNYADEDSGLLQRHVLTWEGEGTVTTRNGIVHSRNENSITFTPEEGKVFQIVITETDPDGTGDHVRDMHLVAEAHMPFFETGAIWNPDWTSSIDDARQFRFMQWQHTNYTEIETWNERPAPGGMTAPGFEKYVPYEYIIQLSNEIGVDAYLQIPHGADDNFIRKFGEYIRDNLDPELDVTIGYSNEVWNHRFDGFRHVADEAEKQWGEYRPGGMWLKLATNAAEIMSDVFKDQEDRLINVLEMQVDSTSRSDWMLKGNDWRRQEPDKFVAPSETFDAVGYAGYALHSVNRYPATKELLSKIRDPNIDAQQWVYEQQLDPSIQFSAAHRTEKLKAQREIADKYGLDMILYEGGSHITQGLQAKGLTAGEQKMIEEFLIEFADTHYMKSLYNYLYDSWSQYGDGPYMQYGDFALGGERGAFAVHDRVLEDSPQAEMLNALNAKTKRWWDEDVGSEHLHGVHELGTSKGERIVGTTQEDYLAGAGGNDTLVGGAEDDGLHGGDGFDVVGLSGKPSDYTVVQEERWILLVGPDGADRLVDVERLAFKDGSVIDIADINLSSGPVRLTEGTTPGAAGSGGSGGSGKRGDDTGGAEGDGGPVAPVATGEIRGDGIRVDAGGDGILVRPDLANDWGTHGVVVRSIYKTSSLGKELGVGRDMDAYAVMEAGADQGYGVQAGKTQDALRNASIAEDVGQLRMTWKDDVFYGTSTDQTVFVGAGDDVVFGRSGDDVLYGNSGDDVIHAGHGDDTMRGGPGEDVFVFKGRNAGSDRIDDLSSDDTLRFVDWFDGTSDLNDMFSMRGGNLVLASGENEITFFKLDMSDRGLVRSVIEDYDTLFA